MPIIFFGSDKFVLPILEKLHAHSPVSLVLTTETIPTDPISAFASENHIPFLSVKKFNQDIASQIKSVNAEVAVLAYFGLILPKSILELFPKGIINIHPSLLPKFRGPTPVQSAILSNDTKTGVSIMKLDSQVDHGPVLAKEEESILETDTAETLHKRLFEKGVALLLTVLPKYISGELLPAPQDDTNATYTEKLTRDSGYFDSTNPSQSLKRMIKAYYPWPGVWTKTTVNNHEIRIKLLPGSMLQVEGKKPQSQKDFINGYPQKRAWVEKLGSY